MPIILDQFGGLIPKLNATKLPDTAAQTAFNVELRGGAIAPLALSGPFNHLHYAGVLKNVDVPTSDVFQIGKPSAPYVSSRQWICNPTWLWIWKTDWMSYIDVSGEKITTMMHAPEPIIGKSIVRTESSMWLIGTFLQRHYPLPYNGDRVVTLTGPRFQFGFEADPTHAHGGPDSTATYPPVISEFDPVFPEISVPLIDTNENVYANINIGDYLGPIYDEDLLVMDYDEITYHVPGQATGVGTWWAAFRIDMNYTNPRRKHLYYVQSRVTSNREGEPSDLSDRITVPPGQRVKLNVESGAKLYRSTTGQDDFLLVDDMTSSSYTDTREQTQSVEIPPYGDCPITNYGLFLRGAFMHPSQFAVALYDNTLYMSDQFRPWAWPDEYTIPFQNATAHILTGNNILVFGNPHVWVVSGSNPEQMSKLLLSSDHPMMALTGLCRIGQTIFWPTYDGLAASSGGQIEIITSEYYTREQWLALSPSTMKCQTADGAILIECEDGTLLRFDYDEGLSAITTYEASLPAPFTWKSKKFDFKDPIAFDHFQLRADGEITVTITADGSYVFDSPVSSASHVPIPDTIHARQWEVQFDGLSTIRSFSMFERIVRTVQGSSIVLNNENTPSWRGSRVKFQDPDRFVAGTLSKQSSSATLTLTADSVPLTPVTVSSGKWFTIPRLTTPDAIDWIIDVNADKYIDELILYSKTQVQAGKSIRETNSGPIPPWLLKTYDVPGDSRLRSGRVHAASDVTMNIYYDGSETPDESISISSRGEFKITLRECGFFEIDFGGSDSEVYEVTLFLPEIMTIGEGGISLSDLQNKRGLLFRFAEPHTFACGLLGADLASYVGGITMRLYADGVLAYPLSGETVTSGQVFRFPRTMERGILWEVDIDTEHTIDTLVLKPWARESVDQVAVTGLSQNGGIPPWMYTEYEFGAPVKLRSGVIRSATYPLTLSLFVDQATTATLDFTPVSDDHEFRFASGIWANTLSFEMTDEADVRDVMLFNEEVIPVENNGVILRPASGRPAWRNKVLQFKDLGSFTVARCVASSYDTLTIKLYANGSLEGTKSIDDEEDVSLTSLHLPRAKEWDLDIAHNGDIRELVLIGDDYAMFNDRAVVIRKENDPFTWIRKRVSSRVPVDFSCIRVLSDDYPVTVRFYNGSTLKKTAVARDEKPFRLERVRPERTWIIDVVPDTSTAQVTEVAVGTSMESLVQ